MQPGTTPHHLQPYIETLKIKIKRKNSVFPSRFLSLRLCCRLQHPPRSSAAGTKVPTCIPVLPARRKVTVCSPVLLEMPLKRRGLVLLVEIHGKHHFNKQQKTQGGAKGMRKGPWLLPQRWVRSDPKLLAPALLQTILAA